MLIYGWLNLNSVSFAIAHKHLASFYAALIDVSVVMASIRKPYLPLENMQLSYPTPQNCLRLINTCVSPKNSSTLRYPRYQHFQHTNSGFFSGEFWRSTIHSSKTYWVDQICTKRYTALHTYTKSPPANRPFGSRKQIRKPVLESWQRHDTGTETVYINYSNSMA